MRLIIRLIAQLIVIVAITLAATSAYVMIDAHKSVEAETAATADRVAFELENLFWREILWRGSMRRDKVLPVPNWESLSTLKLVSPGVCIAFAPAGEEPRQLCSRLEDVGAAAPEWFARAYREAFGPERPVARELTVRAPETGVVVATANADAAVRQAWGQISVVLGVAASMAAAICLLAPMAIARALAPTQTIVEGLRRLQDGHYRRQIAACQAAEFGLIAEAVNDLAERLAQTAAERTALTKRLFEVQEEERRALARDLHDEFGQCLTATLAFAASIEAGASERLDLAEDARSISRVAKRMMTTLREALARLRSQDLEELGLEACLVQLVAGWNARPQSHAKVHLDLAGNFKALPRAVSISIFRIAQECITNAMRHGRANDIRLRIESGAWNDGQIAMTVEDDGGGDPASVKASAGHGILGMRERIAALGGSLSIGRSAHGLCIAARIPLSPPSGATPTGLATA
ncbi:ATP-binding protein [Methylocystis echinoides]|uniref:Histidine kinase n=1 Tax=Methylocystis echinoides TaxID=29468 RepID=A0A9W6LUN6_9HYPH|nr:ATP-binding protein [Methylocystis echinoides]GLI95679.1 histidine kinase [Methylocystis echinoides]